MLFTRPYMLIGYACIAPDDPHLALQREALTSIGCAEIFEERGSTLLVRARLALGRALDACAAGDVLMVCRLNLLGRSPAHAIEILHNLAARGVGLRSLTDGIDLTAPDAALTLRLIHALAEFRASRHEARRQHPAQTCRS
jgi:DNA invertase Pin-like site-specific DNA recombinase